MEYDDGASENLTPAALSDLPHTVVTMTTTQTTDATATQPKDLIDTARPIVWRRGYQAGLSAADREDLLQDVLMKYLQAWGGTSAPDNIEAWLETATANAIIDRIRAGERRPADYFAAGADHPVSRRVSNVRIAPVSFEAVQRRVRSSVFSLVTRADADLLRWRYVDGLSAAEVADRLGISVANVDQRTTRAKRRMRQAMAERPDLVEELRAPHPHVY